MSILIADSGSTKTDWALVKEQVEPIFFQTAGLNPYFTCEEVFNKILDAEVASHLAGLNGLEVYFYGAGCGVDAHCSRISRQLQVLHPSKVEMGSDLLGAARALLQRDNGITCILGTGSNAGFYSEGRIVRTAPSLGFILGDEGGGAWLGKQLVTCYLRNEMPAHLHKAFEQMFHAGREDILQNIYREPAPNRYLAGFARFISSCSKDPWINVLLVEAFSLFFWRYIMPLEPAEGTRLVFTGTVAASYPEIISELAASYGFFDLLIEPSPVKGLVKYHNSL